MGVSEEGERVMRSRLSIVVGFLFTTLAATYPL